MISLDFDQAVARLLQQLEEGKARWMIALAGLPGSGKSTVAALLSQSVNAARPGAMVALGMDGFHLTKVQLQQMPDPDAALARRGAPWTFDARSLAQRLQDVRDAVGHESVAWPDFQHSIGDPVESACFVAPDTRLVLVEGNYLLHRGGDWRRVGECFDERAYLDVSLDVAMERLALRHMEAWGMTRRQALARVAANDRLNADIVLQGREQCDWLLV